MNNDLVRLCILLSILLLAVFPFAGLAPLTLLLLFGVCGWVFQLLVTLTGAADAGVADAGTTDSIESE